jgi:hypothetical protein
MNPNKCGICGNKATQYFYVCAKCRKLPILQRLRGLSRWDKGHEEVYKKKGHKKTLTKLKEIKKC